MPLPDGSRGDPSRQRSRPGCGGAFFSGLLSSGRRLSSIARISARMLTMCGDEAVQFALVLGLGRLDHDRGRPPGKTWWARGSRRSISRLAMSTSLMPVGRLDRADVEDAFVGDAALATGVQHRVVGAQLAGHVVGVEDGHFGGGLETARRPSS